MPFAAINGINLYYEVHGNGPALLFAHGQGGNHLSWWQQIPFFAQHYTCITFDHRAFGFSHDSDGKGRTAFSADVIALLDYLKIEDVRVVAHSMGGRSGISIALRDPEQRCRALVLAGTNGGVIDEEVNQMRLRAAAQRGERGLGAFSVAPSFRTEQPERYYLLRAISRMNPSRPKDFLQIPGPGSRPQGTVAERLTEKGLPVFYVVGELDRIAPPEMIEACHRLIPNSRFSVIKGSGHSAYYERPDEFNREVLQFLRDV